MEITPLGSFAKTSHKFVNGFVLLSKIIGFKIKLYLPSVQNMHPAFLLLADIPCPPRKQAYNIYISDRFAPP